MMTLEVRVGIDPAWKTLGFAVVSFDTETKEIKKLHSQVFNISGYKSLTEGVLAVGKAFTDTLAKIEGEYVFKELVMERFISYKNVESAEFEIINRLIGALTLYFETTHPTELSSRLERAIDWKMSLVKSLHINKQFDNPSTSLDKKFSIAAAKACLTVPVDFKDDHQADATCLACLPIYTKRKNLA
jgi:hypothetical protein